MMRKAALSLLSLTVLSRAQLSGLSPQCTSTIATIATSPDAACLKLPDLLPVALSGSNSSIIQPLDTWLGSFCATSPCSNQTLSAIATNITQGCASDISANPDDVKEASTFLTATLQQYYGTARKILCLKDGSANCITQTLTNLEKVVGPLSLQSAATAIAGINPNSIPKEVICTDCIKTAYNIISTDFPDVVSDAKSGIQSECGASFTDGVNPSSVKQTAVGLLSKDSGALMIGVNGGSAIVSALLGAVYFFI